jgi:hypothetical protein
MTDFDLRFDQNLVLSPQTSLKTHSAAADGHDTISVAAKQLHIIHMGPMMGFAVRKEILMAHQCQAMTDFEL